MKILVVDDEPSFSALLTRALRRLGHTTAAAASAADAAAKVKEERFEAAILALELPDLDGIELAAILRGHDEDLAIAFCSHSGDALCEQAARVGRVLPRVWTVATLRELVASLGRHVVRVAARKPAAGTDPPELWSSAVRKAAGNPLALSARMRPSAPELASPSRAGSPPIPEIIEEVPADDESGHDATAEASPPAKARTSLRKIRLSCRSWDQVERLCAQHAAGRTVLTLRGAHRLELHEPLIVALALPDELVLSLRAEVIAIRYDDTGAPVFAVGLTGLTHAVTARLEVMAANAQSGDINSRPTRKLPRAQSDISFA